MDHDDSEEIFSILILEEMNLHMLLLCMMYMIVASTAAERHYRKHILKDRTFVRSQTRLDHLDKWAAGLVEIEGIFGSFLGKDNDRMEMIASRIGHAKDLDNDKRKINEELLQMSLNTTDRIKLCRKFLKDPENIHLFLGFQGDDKKIFVEMLLQEMKNESD